MNYQELQEYLKEQYGNNVQIEGKVTNLYSNSAYDKEISKYIGFMHSLLTDDDMLYDRLVQDKDLSNLNIYKVNKIFSSEGDLDAIYNHGLLWANVRNEGVEYAIMIDKSGYKLIHEKCRLGIIDKLINKIGRAEL